MGLTHTYTFKCALDNENGKVLFYIFFFGYGKIRLMHYRVNMTLKGEEIAIYSINQTRREGKKRKLFPV